MKLAISEVFYSIQGEGKTIGYPSVFVRLGGCNLMCGGQGTQFDKELHNGATWRCDTIEVWMQAIGKPVADILDETCRDAIKKGAHLIITGGEPTLQAKAVNEFIKYVKDELNENVFVEVETNGTSEPNIKADQWNVSPKLSNSGNEKNVRYNKTALEALNKLNTQFKFVVSREEDMSEILEDFSFIDHDKIWLMPAGDSQDKIKVTSVKVAEYAIKHHYKYTSRLQIDIWNQKTGV